MSKKKVNSHDETVLEVKNTDNIYNKDSEYTCNTLITEVTKATSDENSYSKKNMSYVDECTNSDETLDAEVVNVSYNISVIEGGTASDEESVIKDSVENVVFDENVNSFERTVSKEAVFDPESKAFEDNNCAEVVNVSYNVSVIDKGIASEKESVIDENSVNEDEPIKEEIKVSDEEPDTGGSTVSDEFSDKKDAFVSDEVSDIADDSVSDEASYIEESTVSDEVSFIDSEVLKKKKRRKFIIRTLRILFTIGFFVFAALFIDEVFIQPYKMNRSIKKAQNLYPDEVSKPVINEDNIVSEDEADDTDVSDSVSDLIDNVTPTPTPDPNRDEMGRLKKFANLLEINDDVKGWIRLDNINGENDTKINYVVVQSDHNDPEYYLERAWDTHEYLKAGSIFLDVSSSVEKGSKNLIIHGHNMTSSDDMFHYLLEYNNLDFLKEHPVISFDTIYEEALWKVFSVYITPGNNDRDDFFPFIQSNFTSNREFIEYIYDIRVRSLFNMDEIDINEDDQILTLSTCSYELPNYRTIIVARKVREGEDPTVNTDSFEKKDPKDVLFAPSYYWRYGGKAPKIPSFDEALEEGLIPWYNPINP